MCKNEHSHEIDVIETTARQVCSGIKSKSTSSESPKRILAQVFGVYPNEVLHKLPSTDATAQQIRYKRRKTSEHPPGASNIGFVIPPSSTRLQHGGSFLHYDSADRNRIMTFSVKFNLEVLATCGSWYINGTFKIIPKLFYQLMTVHEKTATGYFRPLMFIMLPSKTYVIDDKTFEALKLLQNSLNPSTSNILWWISRKAYTKGFKKAYRGAYAAANSQTLP